MWFLYESLRMESGMEMDVEELRSELWQILKTEPTQHPSKPPSMIISTIETGSLERTFPESLAARISMSPGFCQEGATEPESSAGGGGYMTLPNARWWRRLLSLKAAVVEALMPDWAPALLSRSVSRFPTWQLFCLQLGQ